MHAAKPADTTEDAAMADVMALLRRLIYAPEGGIAPATRLDDLGLDSLDLVEAGLELEALTGRELPDKVFANAQTVGDLARALAAAGRPGLPLAA